MTSCGPALCSAPRERGSPEAGVGFLSGGREGIGPWQGGQERWGPPVGRPVAPTPIPGLIAPGALAQEPRGVPSGWLADAASGRWGVPHVVGPSLCWARGGSPRGGSGGWLQRRSRRDRVRRGRARWHGYPCCSLGMRRTRALCARRVGDLYCGAWSRDSSPLKDTVCGLSHVSNPPPAPPPPTTLSPSRHPSLHPSPPSARAGACTLGGFRTEASVLRHGSCPPTPTPIVRRGRAEYPQCVALAWTPTDGSAGLRRSCHFSPRPRCSGADAGVGQRRRVPFA